MSCAACAARVEKAVKKVEGVSSCAVNLLTNTGLSMYNLSSVQAGDNFRKQGKCRIRSGTGETEEYRMKRMLVWGIALALMLCCAASARADHSYEGTVVAGEVRPISAGFGGKVGGITLKIGDEVAEGQSLGTIQSTMNFAPVEGTVTGLYAAEGDDVESVISRYGALLYLEPTNRYLIKATTDKAYNASENHYIHLGERVYLTCTPDGSHTGTGMISALSETEGGYEVEVTGGDFYMGEKVDIYRNESRKKESNIGRGVVGRAAPVPVKGVKDTGSSVLRLHVANGDFVERGELLFETVDGALDGLYSPGNEVLSPASGVVSSIEKKNGEDIMKGETLLSIIPLDTLQVEFSIPEADVFLLKKGQPVKMELYWDNEKGRTLEGTITSIARMNTEAETDSENQRKTYKAYANFPKDERVSVGMTVILYVQDEGEAQTEE